MLFAQYWHSAAHELVATRTPAQIDAMARNLASEMEFDPDNLPLRILQGVVNERNAKVTAAYPNGFAEFPLSPEQRQWYIDNAEHVVESYDDLSLERAIRTLRLELILHNHQDVAAVLPVFRAEQTRRRAVT